MSWAGSEPWDMFLGVAGSGLARRGDPPIWKDHTDPVHALGERFDELRQQRGAWRRPRARIWLSGALARPFLLEPLAGLSGTREVLAVAEARAPEATGLPSPCMVWLERATADQPRLAVAYARDLNAAVLDAARHSKVRLATLRPWWALALGEALAHKPDTGLFAAEDGDSITLLSACADTWLTADTYVPKPEAEQAEAIITRRAFAAGLPSDAVWRARLNMELRPDVPTWPAAQRLDGFGAA